MEQSKLNKILELHRKWLNNEKDGKKADLRDTDLRDANLRGAYLDFSTLPLWCGGLNFTIDERLAKQLVYHVVNLMQTSNLDVNKIFKKQVYKWLEDSHVVIEHGLPKLEEK
ncbi:MAG: pentapeptide repeat-containing protein [Candidatus Izemoplasmatales bacterium]|nr:pentapeptide repeat-containing protein [Candidatus Izemoplasmatales bacterium]